MCGIFCFVTRDDDISPSLEENSLRRIKRRGPDYWFSRHIKLSGSCNIHLANSVLHLRGDEINRQPNTTDISQSHLLWNGEIFGGYDVPRNKNDTEFLSELLNTVYRDEDIVGILSKICGPWALIYYQAEEGKLWFGRDVLGRRSLLWQFNEAKNAFTLSSVVDDHQKWLEVPAKGIFYINLKDLAENPHLTYFPWSNQVEGEIDFNHFDIELEIRRPIKNPIANKLNTKLPSDDDLEPNNVVFEKATRDFIDALRISMKTRIENQRGVCKNCSAVKSDVSACSHPKTGILFSGGIDSSVLARLADEFVAKTEPIDLLNVAFVKKIENGRVEREVPDRVSGRIALGELKMICPLREWNFVEINISSDELRDERHDTISSLINPCKTVLDDSIGCSIWFAARGIGVTSDGDCERAYASPCRVLLVGMGADEQLAGYSRHRMRFANEGWRGLVEEIEMEVSRLSWRNLGRDDRVIADHGCEARFPFLDERVVEYLNSTPIWLKADLNLPRGFGEKLLLRGAAKVLGFDRVCTFAKRAIQFGSRISKIEEKKQKGSDVMKE